MDAAGSGGSSEQLPTFAHLEGQVAEGEAASEGGGAFAPAPGRTPGARLTGSLRGRGSEEAALVTGSCCAVLQCWGCQWVPSLPHVFWAGRFATV